MRIAVTQSANRRCRHLEHCRTGQQGTPLDAVVPQVSEARAINARLDAHGPAGRAGVHVR
jgi:hypothetical protein